MAQFLNKEFLEQLSTAIVQPRCRFYLLKAQ